MQASPTLNYSSLYDSIYANSYSGTVTISNGKVFTDNTNLHSGDVSSNLPVIAGKTLKPYAYTLELDENMSADYDGKAPAGLTVTMSYSVPTHFTAEVSTLLPSQATR